MQHLLPSCKIWGPPLQHWFRHMGHLNRARGLWTFLFFFFGEGHPQKTSLLVKERYHFTSSLSSRTLFTNKWDSPLAGRLFCSAQSWRALAYATTFSLGTSQMSWHAKIESVGGTNFFLQRHSSAGGAWRVASLESNSHICCGSMKDALTSLANLLASLFPGTASSSSHQSGVSHLSDFQGTHLLKFVMLGYGGVSLLSSSEVSGDACRKEATVGFNSSSSSKSELCLWTLHHPVAPWVQQIGLQLIHLKI